jgi:hypothetical protein
MDESLEFKKILSQNSDGTEKNMILMPYAKNLSYTNGELSMAIEFFNDNAETEIGITIQVSDELGLILDRLMLGEVV